jgi:hypothetical protein
MPWHVLALLANPYADMSSDIVATRDVAAAPAQVVAALADLHRAEALFDEGCVGAWEVGPRSSGEGATVDLRWTPGPMNRRLTVRVVDVDGERKVVWEGEGPRGFFVYWRVAAAGDGSAVKVETPLLPPPWPVRGLFHHEVKPAWQACYEAALARLDGVAR